MVGQRTITAVAARVLVVVGVHNRHVAINIIAQNGIRITFTALRWIAMACRGTRFTARRQTDSEGNAERKDVISYYS